MAGNEISGYNFSAIEKKWQSYWQENQTFAAPDGLDKPKFYVLDMFPYPSSEGLHVGHPEGYTASDIVSRYKRMKGFNVLHPMGYDAFGLPAEQYAVQTGTHPQVTTAKNINNIERQIKMFGFSYDWSRRLATTDIDYYCWTQWIFLKMFNSWYDPIADAARPISELIQKLENHEYMVSPTGEIIYDTTHPISVLAGEPVGTFKYQELTVQQQRQIIDDHRLAYIAEVPVNWCPKLGTVLANEEVNSEGYSERGNYPVFRRALKQWMLRITRYAERLLEDLEELDWPESIKIMQRNWIGKSTGAEVCFAIEGKDDEVIEVYTTRPDTLFGATYMVLSPEHPLVAELTTDLQRQAVLEYVRQAARKSELERTADTKEKTGVFIGTYAINPVNQERIPIWVADYVLMGYGTGAIMAVPAHDTRDLEFAEKFDLPIIQVVQPPEDVDWHGYVDEGIAVNSGPYDGLTTAEFKKKITDWLEEQNLGRGAVNYKLRDWLFSRQRYWGEPFPIVHCEKCGTVSLPEEDLPLELTETDDFTPDISDDPDSVPSPPLGKLTEWINTTCPSCGGSAQRELNTMPQWAGSCWYYLRYLDAKNNQAPFDKDKERYWMPVDLYIGGAEHAVLHLLYARFWHKVLYDLGWVSTKEPFVKLVNQGMILGEDNQKMSKSRGNVVNPDTVVEQYGADSFRLYEMFMGPLQTVKPWRMQDVEGVYRFLNKAWRMIIDAGGSVHANITDAQPEGEALRRLHKTIKKVTEDIETLAFNTAISQMMIFVNEYLRLEKRSKKAMETFVLLLSPFAPHIAEELWQRLGHPVSLAYETWPSYNPKLTIDPEVELAVQINGKTRAKITVPADSEEKTIEETALESENVRSHLAGKTVRKVIVVKNRLVNIVAN
ncbi:MAG: leucyl-tRNA synthetase [Phycisphaerae bacterium SM23_30]|nr:MAG: leucyl-tRNA synthetase [Phycisphaerae bacterium SM23_30]